MVRTIVLMTLTPTADLEAAIAVGDERSDPHHMAPSTADFAGLLR